MAPLLFRVKAKTLALAYKALIDSLLQFWSHITLTHYAPVTSALLLQIPSHALASWVGLALPCVSPALPPDILRAIFLCHSSLCSCSASSMRFPDHLIQTCNLSLPQHSNFLYSALQFFFIFKFFIIIVVYCVSLS